MGSTELNVALVLLLQLTAMCACQKFGSVNRRPVTTDRRIAVVGQQQYANDASAPLSAAVAGGDVYQPYPEQQLYNYPAAQQYNYPAAAQQYNYPAAAQQYYYPSQEKQTLAKQQQSRLEQQQLQLQQLQQLQSQQKQQQQQQQQQQPAWEYYQPTAAPQQYNGDYRQQQQQQQLQQQQQQLQQQQQQLQQQYYQSAQKPLFRPAAIPVNEPSAEGPQQQKPTTAGSYQQQVGGANQQLPQNPLGVYYSSAADVSKFQFSGNGVNYSY